MQAPLAASPATTAQSSLSTPAAVAADALASETRLLGELIAIMHAQRAAVAADDRAAVDDTVFATQRVLHTLTEARRRRHSLGRVLGAPEDASPRALEAALGAGTSDAVRRAIDELMAAALRLSREVERNRQALRQALAGGAECALPPRFTPPLAAAASAA